MANFEIDITYECNLSCKYCDRLCGTKFNKPDILSINQLQKYIISISPYIEPRSRISILGGEPTLHPQLFDILDLIVKEIRPKMIIPINICSNGIGKKVNDILDQVRIRYTTYNNPNILSAETVSIQKSDKQFCIVMSKIDPTYVKRKHRPIFRAAIDFMPNQDFSKKCFLKDRCGYGITPYGIYICAAHSIAISKIFKLGNGLNHFPTQEEEKEQIEKICKYCRVPCEGIGKVIISPTYEEAIKEWMINPYYMEIK